MEAILSYYGSKMQKQLWPWAVLSFRDPSVLYFAWKSTNEIE
jgi:hypothetical protein